MRLKIFSHETPNSFTWESKYFLPRTQNTFTWDSKPTATYFVRSMQGVLLSILRILVILNTKTCMKTILIYHENHHEIHHENLHCCLSFAQELRPGPTRCFPRRSWILALGTFWFVFWYDVRLIFNDDIDKKLDPGSWHLLDGQCHRLPIDCDKPGRLTITVLLFLFVK